LGGKTSRKTQVSCRFFKLRRTVKIDTQRLREKLFQQLNELFDLASAFARGRFEYTYQDGQREKVTLKARKKWVRAAACVAQIINNVSNGIDERQLDKDMDMLELLINEVTAKVKVEKAGEEPKGKSTGA
jgi:hypothetical protein